MSREGTRTAARTGGGGQAVAAASLHRPDAPGRKRSATACSSSTCSTVGYFVYDSLTPPVAGLVCVDLAIATVLALDFAARVFIARRRWRYLLDPLTIVDAVVILTLVLPLLIENGAFLRVLRAVRLLRSYRVLQDLRGHFPFVGRNQHVIVAIIDLVVFVFVITAVVFITQHTINPDIATYTDALYFTVATLDHDRVRRHRPGWRLRAPAGDRHDADRLRAVRATHSGRVPAA